MQNAFAAASEGLDVAAALAAGLPVLTDSGMLADGEAEYLANTSATALLTLEAIGEIALVEGMQGASLVPTFNSKRRGRWGPRFGVAGHRPIWRADGGGQCARAGELRLVRRCGHARNRSAPSRVTNAFVRFGHNHSRILSEDLSRRSFTPRRQDAKTPRKAGNETGCFLGFFVFLGVLATLRLGVKSLARDDLPIARQRKQAC